MRLMLVNSGQTVCHQGRKDICFALLSALGAAKRMLLLEIPLARDFGCRETEVDGGIPFSPKKGK